MRQPDPLKALAGHYQLRPDKVLFVCPDAGSLYYRWHDYIVALTPRGPLTFISEFGEQLVFRCPAPQGDCELQLTDAQSRTFVAPRVHLVDEEALSTVSHQVQLRGTLLLPPSPGPHPAVVLVHGAGPDSRDWYRLTADHFVRSGIAALVYDKRGVGASEGDYFDSTFDDLAQDAAAWVAQLRAHPRLDSQRVGLWGVSEGAWVVCLAAARHPEVAFVICKSGAGMSPGAQEQFRRVIWPAQHGRRWPHTVAAALSYAGLCFLLRCLPAARIPRRGGLRLFARTLDYNPIPVLRRIHQPLLALWGAEDACVPAAESAHRFAQVLTGGGNERTALHVFPHANHGIRLSRPELLPCRRVSAPGHLETTSRWIWQAVQ